MVPADDRAIDNRTAGNMAAEDGIDNNDVVHGVVDANNYANDSTVDNIWRAMASPTGIWTLM